MMRAAVSRFGRRAATGNSFRCFTVPAMVKPTAHEFGDFKLYIDGNTFGWLVMDRKGESANALGTPYFESLDKAMDFIQLQVAMKTIKVLILTSAKKTFCVGADIKEVYTLTDEQGVRNNLTRAREVLRKFTDLSVPTVAAINGTALGGGLEMALACDYRVCTTNPKVQLGLPEIQLGVIPGLGGTVRFPRICGLQAALSNVLAGKSLRPDKAKKIRLVDQLIDEDDRYPGENRFAAAARQFASRKIDGKKRKYNLGWMDWFLACTPLGRYLVIEQTMKGLKKDASQYRAPWAAFESIMNASMPGVGFETAMNKESDLFAKLCVSGEAKNLMSVFFLMDNAKKMDKQPGFKKTDVRVPKKAGVIGAGVMGSGIVQHVAKAARIPVYVQDISDEAVQKGLDFCTKEFNTSLKRKSMTKVDHAEATQNVTGGTSTDEFKSCDIIIEAAVEMMDLKKKMIGDLEQKGHFHANNFFATNTSSLSVTEMSTAASAKLRPNVVGMHFFNPVKRMPLVEVIAAKETSPAAMASVYQLALDMGKTPIVVGDGPGFLVNRILGVYMTEAGRLLEEGADPVKTDKLIKGFGMPMGPFRLLDEVGLDVAAHVAPILSEGLGARFTGPNKINELVDAGFLGKKKKGGFYKYVKEGKKEKEVPHTEMFNQMKIAPSSGFKYDDVLDRMMLLMGNEAVMILEEGIATSPEDVDLGMIFGTGYAPFRGGLLNYMDHRGLPDIVERMHGLTKTYGDRFKPCARLEQMAKENKTFFPNRPGVKYTELQTPPSPAVTWWPKTWKIW